MFPLKCSPSRPKSKPLPSVNRHISLSFLHKMKFPYKLQSAQLPFLLLHTNIPPPSPFFNPIKLP